MKRDAVRWDDILAKAAFFGVLALLLVVPGVLWYMGLKLLAVLFTAPLAAWFLVRWLMRSGGDWWDWFVYLPFRRWQGNYYSFNDVQVRVLEDEGDLWFVVADVLESIGMKGIPDSYLAIYPKGCKVLRTTRLTAMNAEALEALLGKRNEHEAIRFLQWMRREVIKPWERKKEAGVA